MLMSVMMGGGSGNGASSKAGREINKPDQRGSSAAVPAAHSTTDFRGVATGSAAADHGEEDDDEDAMLHGGGSSSIDTTPGTQSKDPRYRVVYGGGGTKEG